MNKNKLISLAILAVLIVLPFRAAYINLSVESELIQVFSMAIVIFGSMAAIFFYNKGAEESNHH